jgi:hypothetical protein
MRQLHTAAATSNIVEARLKTLETWSDFVEVKSFRNESSCAMNRILAEYKWSIFLLAVQPVSFWWRTGFRVGWRLKNHSHRGARN